MAYITEEIEHPEIDGISIEILQYQKSENPFKEGIQGAIDLNISFSQSSYTPEQLLSLGNWLIEQANDIQTRYTKEYFHPKP